MAPHPPPSPRPGCRQTPITHHGHSFLATSRARTPVQRNYGLCSRTKPADYKAFRLIQTFPIVAQPTRTNSVRRGSTRVENLWLSAQVAKANAPFAMHCCKRVGTVPEGGAHRTAKGEPTSEVTSQSSKWLQTSQAESNQAARLSGVGCDFSFALRGSSWARSTGV